MDIMWNGKVCRSEKVKSTVGKHVDWSWQENIALPCPKTNRQPVKQ